MQTSLLDNIQKTNGPNSAQSTAVFGTQEWASCNANYISGCRHNCKYCYSKAMAIRFGRKTAASWKNEVVRKSSLNRKFNRVDGTIMFPSSHDIHPDHLAQSLIFLRNILLPGNRVLIVTKPHLECISAICGEYYQYQDNILFRFTIGSSDSKTLRFWEPGAPDFQERLKSLKYAYEHGFQTSVSCEPMLDGHIEDVIEKVSPFVTDSIWLGKANSLFRRLKINGEYDQETLDKANHLYKLQSDQRIIDTYLRYRTHPKIKWKESIKKIVGIDIPTEKGLDI